MNRLDRLSEIDAQDLAVKYAGEYVNERFKDSKDQVNKSLVLNTLAHGYYMGVRRLEEIANSKWRKFIFGSPAEFTEKWLLKESLKAAQYYIVKKGYVRLAIFERALIQATISKGFKVGFKTRALDVPHT